MGAGSDAQVLVYMDVDLSTDLNALLPLVAPLISGHSDLAIGTRLGRGSCVERGPQRELISRGYNLLLRGRVSPFSANLLALLLTAVANTAVNRRLTFGVRGRRGALRDQLRGLVVFAIGLGVTSGSLWLLHAAGSPSRGVEVLVLTVANLVVTVLRFVAMRAWVFSRRARRPGAPPMRPVAPTPGGLS